MLTLRDAIVTVVASAGLFAAFALAISFIPIADPSGETLAPAESSNVKPRLSPPPELLISDYADMKAEFDAHVRGPLVLRSNITSYEQRESKPKPALLLAPEIELAEEADSAAVKTVLLDLEIAEKGNLFVARATVLSHAESGANLSPEERLAREVVNHWQIEPFERDGQPVRALIKNVPARVLLSGSSGRIKYEAKKCRKFSIVRERHEHKVLTFHSAMTVTDHRAELTSDGKLSFEGKLGVAVRGNHTGSVSGVAVRRLIGDLLNANLLKLEMQGRLENSSDNHWLSIGRIQVMCDGRTLLILPITMTRSEGETLDGRIAALGIDRYTTGTDETLSLLESSGWDFSVADRDHVALIGHLAKSLSVAGMRDLVRRGAPLTLVQQIAPGIEPAPVLKILAEQGRGDIVRALLASDLAWSRVELSAALVALTPFDDPATFVALLAAGANVNARDARGFTALMKCPNQVVAKRLLEAGADLKLPGNNRLLRANNTNCTETIQAIEKWALARERPH